ncbi:phage portal protein [Nocardioides kribbensis]|uniref:phage portal protein n=1 Tax=Nocardioides kribbensis TaxID=305517 RepID=UPI0018797627|nr:phage portal protein [Nocardioides kribbensis]
MALTPSELELIDSLKRDLDARSLDDELLLRYYRGRQRVEQLGMAIPPAMRRFLVVTNWCRTVVDTINDRQQVRSLILPGQETADPQLRAIWDSNNLSAHVAMFNRDRMIYGRGFMSVGANEDNSELPLVRVESPREMVARVDYRREIVTAAARFYGTADNGYGPTNVTLYLPNVTVWVERSQGDGRWYEVDRDPHNLGVVPVVMHLNRRMSGGWVGESQFTDVIPLVDAAARSLTNLQFAQEAHGVPRMWMAGVKKEDFLDADGKPVPQFEAYFDAIHTITDAAGKVGQLTAADLKNFETALNIYGVQASIETGFPARYFGLLAANPPTEGSIRADEARLVRSVESQNVEVGTTLGWVGALAYRFATGRVVEGNQVRTDWFDPATPTVSQREDALAKRHAEGVLSREGYWDELGWSEARKAKERAYFEAEALDPVTRAVMDGLSNDAANAAVGA